MSRTSTPRPIRTVCLSCGTVLVDVPEDARGVSHGACSAACWQARAEANERRSQAAEATA